MIADVGLVCRRLSGDRFDRCCFCRFVICFGGGLGRYWIFRSRFRRSLWVDVGCARRGFGFGDGRHLESGRRHRRCCCFGRCLADRLVAAGGDLGNAGQLGTERLLLALGQRSPSEAAPERHHFLGRRLAAPGGVEERLGQRPQVHGVGASPRQGIAGKGERSALGHQFVWVEIGDAGIGGVQRAQFRPALRSIEELCGDAAQRVLGAGDVVAPHRHHHRRLLLGHLARWRVGRQCALIWRALIRCALVVAFGSRIAWGRVVGDVARYCIVRRGFQRIFALLAVIRLRVACGAVCVRVACVVFGYRSVVGAEVDERVGRVGEAVVVLGRCSVAQAESRFGVAVGGRRRRPRRRLFLRLSIAVCCRAGRCVVGSDTTGSELVGEFVIDSGLVVGCGGRRLEGAAHLLAERTRVGDLADPLDHGHRRRHPAGRRVGRQRRRKHCRNCLVIGRGCRRRAVTERLVEQRARLPVPRF